MSGTDAGPAAGDRWAWAAVDLDAIVHNVRSVLTAVRPAGVRAVVKADGYGHGAVPVANAALHAGAEGLCVALVHEGIALREAGVRAPILLLSEQPPEQAALIVEHDLTPTVYTVDGVDALIAAGGRDLPVHIKLDTGMQRVGVQRDAIDAVVKAIVESAPALRLEGVYTHLAVADEPDNEFTGQQLAEFDAVLASLETPRSSTPPTRRAVSPIQPHGGRSCVSASPCTVSSPGPAWSTCVATCVRRCRSTRVCHTSSGSPPARASRTDCGTRSLRTRLWRLSRSAMPTEYLAGCRCSVDTC